MLDKMKSHIDLWKNSIENEGLNLINYKAIVPDEGIFVHYTPRWPLILHFACAILCFGFSSIYH